MMRREPRGRSGITLTEILISILIMGVGLVSLATLFPLGLLRLRDAARLSRSAYLTESASADVESRDLFNQMSFLNFSPWYSLGGVVYNPWVQDTVISGTTAPITPSLPKFNSAGGTPLGAYRGYGMDGTRSLGFAYNGAGTVFPNPGPGLPVAYDPLWWSVVGALGGSYSGLRPLPGLTGAVNNQIEARFGYVPWLVSGQSATAPGGLTPCYGLQRVTNFLPTATMDLASRDTFISPEDIVWQVPPDQNSTGISPIVPDMAMGGGSVTNDFRFTWMFTGQQTDSQDGAVFDGDVVVFENRPFGLDANGNVDGEIGVEAVFGYSTNAKAASYYYGPQDPNTGVVLPSRTVLLRWRSDLIPDPEVKVGSWIADVTYERFAANDFGNELSYMSTAGFIYPRQRCYWYQVAKKSQPTNDVLGAANYRSMTVWVKTPLRALTVMSGGQPAYPNAALISPFVANVFPRTFYSRGGGASR
jgi:hypothetical protein